MSLMQQLYALSAEQAARRLLGAKLIRTLTDGRQASAKIVETEAYDQEDPASHTFIGPTLRNQAMFGPAGHAYVYRSYGIHWCLNVVAGETGYGAGVLIRAVEPMSGLDIMQTCRPGMVGVNITNGPGKLTQALAIDDSFNHHDLSTPPLELYLTEPAPANTIVTAVRVGITKAREVLRRYYLKDSSFVSKL